MSEQCKYGCADGRYYEPSIRKYVECPDCKTDRTKNLRVGLAYSGKDDKHGEPDMVTLEEITGFPVKGGYVRWNHELVIPPSIRRGIASGLQETLDLMNKIIDVSVLGNDLDDSYIVGLTSQCNIKHFAFTYLINYYKSSGSYYKALTIKEYLALSKTRVDLLNFEDYEAYKTSMQAIHNARGLVVFLTSGGNAEEIESAKGLMQDRGIRGLGTVFVTTMPRQYLGELMSGDEQYLNAKGEFITANQDNRPDANRGKIAVQGLPAMPGSSNVGLL